MAPTNPYNFDDGIDSDLWKKDPKVNDRVSFSDTAETADMHVATENAEPCPHCGEVHMLPNALRTLPRQLHNLTSVLLDGFEHDIIGTISGQTPPPALKLMAAMVSFSRDVRYRRSNGPAIRALVEVVDELTDGKVKAKTQQYRAEMGVVTAHIILKSMNDFAEQMAADIPASYDDKGNMLEMAQHMRAYHQASLTEAIERYRAVCGEYGLPLDQDFIDNGRYKKGSAIRNANQAYLDAYFDEDDW